jgi:hypothetical protein
MIKRNSFKLKLIFFAVLFSGLTVLNVYAKDQCIICHKDARFQTQNKVLYDYYNYWKDSVHDAEGIICIDCHGGDEHETDKDLAHKKNFSSLNPKDKTSHKKIPTVCGNCHKVVLKHFSESKHYKAILKEINSPNCVTCHGSMNTEVYEASNIAKGCQTCHNEETKESPEVCEKAENILSQINFIRAFRKWVLVHYSDKEPKTVKEINVLYKDIVYSWHKFDFKQMEEKTQRLLLDLRSLFKKGLAEKRKNKKS